MTKIYRPNSKIPIKERSSLNLNKMAKLRQPIQIKGMGKIYVVKPSPLIDLQDVKFNSLKDSASEKVIAITEKLSELFQDRFKIKIADILCDAEGRLPILTAEPDFMQRIKDSGGNLGVLDHTVILEVLDKNTARLYFLRNKENIAKTISYSGLPVPPTPPQTDPAVRGMPPPPAAPAPSPKGFKVTQIKPEGMPSTSEIAEINRKFKNIAEVSVTDFGLEIKFTSKISDSTLKDTLNELKKYGYERSVTSLNLGNTRVTDTGLRYLSGLTNLQNLNLSWNQVSDLSPLNSFTNLQKLSLAGTQVSNLNPLSSLISLKWLNLNETRVSDLRPLSSLTNLKELHLWQTRVSNKSVEELKKKIPGLKIIT
jgi:uncharacterized protein (DUF1697 family)